MPNPIHSLPGQHAGMTAPGTIDLSQRPMILNQDNSESTVYSSSFKDMYPGSPNYGREVLLPLADENRIMSMDEAVQKYYRSGGQRHLGAFESPDHADAYAEKLHRAWGAPPLQQIPTPPVSSHSPYGDTQYPVIADAMKAYHRKRKS